MRSSLLVSHSLSTIKIIFYVTVVYVFHIWGKIQEKNWDGPVATADTILNVFLHDLMLYLNNQMYM